jgi:hypothetical protein
VGIYNIIDMQVTLRCNAACRNCIKFCGMQDRTGLDYSDTDLTLGQVEKFVENIRDIASRTEKRPIVNLIGFTGGECTLHPQLEEIVACCQPLVADGLVPSLVINSNLVNPIPPKWQHMLLHASHPRDNPKIHHAALIHPVEPTTFKACTHYRKSTVVFNCYGYNLCCAADAYIRLYNLEELILPWLPDDPCEFEEKMDLVCCHCPFGAPHQQFERDVGSPISEEYMEEAEKNKAGRKIRKRFQGKPQEGISNVQDARCRQPAV